MNTIKKFSNYISILLWVFVFFLLLFNDFHICIDNKVIKVLVTSFLASMFSILASAYKYGEDIDYWAKKYENAVDANVEKANIYINARNMLERCIYEHYKPIMQMTEEQMFEKSFQRPSNYFKLSERQQWDIDSALGILDWEGGKLTEEQLKRFNAHYDEVSTTRK